MASAASLPRHCKILCTLGPASNTPEVIGALIDAGMNAARLNLSHGSHDDHTRVYKTVRKEASRRGIAVARPTNRRSFATWPRSSLGRVSAASRISSK